ncbi:GNAT family N-acetyltransferase [Labrys okinawensis]|uniref:GNAT family N-acetyltransferase n=1 Tax=Labrys okinawensis TaxID=346911 RepID=UPI0039BD7D3A
MNREIRLATAADSSAVRALVWAAYSPYVARIGREPGPMGDDYDALIRDGRVHVIGEGEQILGLLVLLPEPDTMLLDNVAVDPAHQGSGVGRALLQWAEQAALGAGFSVIRLYTNEAMTENVSLYSRIGYVETGRGEEKGLKRVYMTKRLR